MARKKKSYRRKSVKSQINNTLKSPMLKKVTSGLGGARLAEFAVKFSPIPIPPQYARLAAAGFYGGIEGVVAEFVISGGIGTIGNGNDGGAWT